MARSTLIVLLVLVATACNGTVTDTVPRVVLPQLTATQRPPTEKPPTPTLALPTDTPLLPTTPPPTSTSTASPAPIARRIPDPAAHTWQLAIDHLTRPVGLNHAGDDSGRLFITEQGGLIKIFQDAQIISVPFLNIQDKIGTQGSEQGLLGLAFHPQFVQNGYFFVNYTDKQGSTVIARYQISEDPNRADPGSETRLMHISQPYANHNGGALVFGPDSYLYLGLGDGGSGGDPLGNGQSLHSLLGKILRIDVDHGENYSIPLDNPFLDEDAQPEIWASGLRNPWRFAFDSLTGDLYIGDVGQNLWEEIDFLPAEAPGGLNLGWNYFESNHPFSGEPPADMGIMPPIAEYSHDMGCSVTGGVVYRGQDLPDWDGVYLYGDYCSGNVWGLLRDTLGNWENTLLFENVGRISSFGADEFGEIYLVDHSGFIYTLVKR